MAALHTSGVSVGKAMTQGDSIDKRCVLQCKYLWYLHLGEWGIIKGLKHSSAFSCLLLLSKPKRRLLEPKGRISEFSSNPFFFPGVAARRNMFTKKNEIFGLLPKTLCARFWAELLALKLIVEIVALTTFCLDSVLCGFPPTDQINIVPNSVFFFLASLLRMYSNNFLTQRESLNYKSNHHFDTRVVLWCAKKKRSVGPTWSVSPSLLNTHQNHWLKKIYVSNAFQ